MPLLIRHLSFALDNIPETAFCNAV